jgi:hypothetical protein
MTPQPHPRHLKSATEYRLKWRRDGRQWSYRIYQTWSAAYRKAQGIVALEEIKDDTKLADMPSLVEGPVIEERAVAAWEPSELHMVVTDATRNSMRAYFAPDDDQGYGPF